MHFSGVRVNELRCPACEPSDADRFFLWPCHPKKLVAVPTINDQGPAPDMQNRIKRTMAVTLQVWELFGKPGPGCGVSVVLPSQLVAKDHGVPKFGLKSSHVSVRHRNA